MNGRHKALIAAIGAIVVAAACGKPAPKPAGKAATPPDSVTKGSMPGMGDTAKEPAPPGKLATTVTFTAAQIQHGGVRWGTVTMGTASGTATLPAELTPNEDRTARLGAPARGRVLSVSVQPGDPVAAGQTLVTLQSPEAGMAQSDVAKAEAEVASRRAEAQYAASARARAERLLALKAIPRQDYDRAITDDEHARAALAQADAELRRARATANQLSVASGANGEIVLRAPVAGVVLARTAVPGTVVEAGAPLIVVTDLANLWLIINAPEQFAGLFHRGGRLRFSVSAYPADTFTARVDAVAPGLHPDTRTLDVRGIVANAGRLKPQMLATVVVEGVGSVSAALVPDDAVQLIQGKPYVFLARPEDKGGARFERREVLLGSRVRGSVAVLRGLTAGDVIVTAGAFAIKAELQKATSPKMVM